VSFDRGIPFYRLRSAAGQEHSFYLYRLPGRPIPAEHGVTGAEYSFEKGVPVTALADRSTSEWCIRCLAPGMPKRHLRCNRNALLAGAVSEAGSSSALTRDGSMSKWLV